MEVEAIWEPLGPRLGALVLLAVRYQKEQSMTSMAGVYGGWSLEWLESFTGM